MCEKLSEETFRDIFDKGTIHNTTQAELNIQQFHVYAAKVTSLPLSFKKSIPHHINHFTFIIFQVIKTLANSLDLKRYYFGRFYSVAFGHPDIQVYLDRLSAGQDVSDFTLPILPHYLPLYFLNQLAEHVQQQKYIKIDADPIFDDEHSSAKNNDIIRKLLENEEVADDSISQYCGERIPHSKLNNDDIREITQKSSQVDVFPTATTSEAPTVEDDEIFRRDDENRKGPTWIAYHDKEKFSTLKTYNQRKKTREGSPKLILSNHSRIQPTHACLEEQQNNEEVERTESIAFSNSNSFFSANNNY